MRQKVMIVAAFMTEAKLLVVDEPFLRFGPARGARLVEPDPGEKEQGVGILMSTHVLDTAQRYCDRFVLLADGKVKTQGTLAELTAGGQTLDEVYLNLARDEQHG